MSLKRKRSCDELCSSPSTASTTSSSSSFFSSPPSSRTFMLDVSPGCFPFPTLSSSTFVPAPAHLHSRTMKRFRDGRPSEDEVHQHTLNLLFNAQQQHHPQQPSSPSPSQIHTSTMPTTAQASSGQHSLHRFWNISSAPAPRDSTSADIAVSQAAATPSNCEDCGAGLRDADTREGMDVDGMDFSDAACGACGKHVCFSCSVSNLGEQKRCLQCAGRKVLVGGDGWNHGGMSIC